jgi:hypothetical protein
MRIFAIAASLVLMVCVTSAAHAGVPLGQRTNVACPNGGVCPAGTCAKNGGPRACNVRACSKKNCGKNR